MSDDDVLREFEAALHAEGWSDRVTVERSLATWLRLAGELLAYPLEIEDYTNDLFARDALELALARLPEPQRAALAAHVEPADERFRAASVADEARVLARHIRVREKDGWWWHRVPRSGPLAELLHD